MKKHVNIPIFIPHLGCPNQCVFCNQRAITGTVEFRADSVRDEIEEALMTVDPETEAEIAFFGGSFTGIERELMIDLLEIANRYIISGRVKSIRCSTRPDYINQEVLDILKRYNVKVIELGLQSADDTVLQMSKRGHSFECEREACALITKNGFELVGQMMIGLPGSDRDAEIRTAEFIVRSGAKSARIYPTVVFNDTELCAMAQEGLYTPISISDAVSRSADVFRIFVENGISVIRIGLCASENLSNESTYYAGPNHSALGELVESEFYYRLLTDKISAIDTSTAESVKIYCARGELSKVIGHKKTNKHRLQSKISELKLIFLESAEIGKYTLDVCAEERKIKCI